MITSSCLRSVHRLLITGLLVHQLLSPVHCLLLPVHCQFTYYSAINLLLDLLITSLFPSNLPRPKYGRFDWASGLSPKFTSRNLDPFSPSFFSPASSSPCPSSSRRSGNPRSSSCSPLTSALWPWPSRSAVEWPPLPPESATQRSRFHSSSLESTSTTSASRTTWPSFANGQFSYLQLF